MSLPCFLLVDDLEENLLSLEAVLRRDGLKLLKARSGDEALELLLKNDVALALVDIQMPGLSGFELAELMRGNERTRRVPIIFVTAGSADNQRRFQGYEAGAVDFIQKPIEPDILRSKADVFLELYLQRQQITAQRDELAAHSNALKEADRRKDEFLATLAHELRNPLAPLRYGLDTLKRNPESEVAAEVRDVMDRQLAHLVRLIDDLLDVSRVSQGKIELRKERIDIAAVIRAAVEASKPFIESAGHALTVVVPPESVWVEADHTRLAQVIANLLNNAAKYTPSGGRILLSAKSESDEVQIEVTDTGVGIPEDMYTKIFELFAQLDGPSGRAHGGLGIGLALVKQLVEMHGGTVEAGSSGESTGSTFTVRLPTIQQEAVTAPERAERETPTMRALKVLVVDDMPDVAQTVGWLLEEIGHDYRLVHDGRRAVDAAKDYRPDVILLDIGLPGMDGYQVCRALRQIPMFENTPIIAQTGWGQNQDKTLAAESGFTLHLTKPVPLEELETTLSTLAPAQRS